MNGGKWNKMRPLNFFFIVLNIRYSFSWFESSLRTFFLKKERVNSERRWWGKSLNFTCYSMLCHIRAIIRTPSPSVTVTKLRANPGTAAQRTLIIWAARPRLCFRYSVVSNPYDQFNDRCLSLEIVLSWKCLYFIAISLLPASQMEFGQAAVWILFYPINLPLS